MHCLVCYTLEKAVIIDDDDVDPTNLDGNCPPHLKKFLQEVGKNPIAKIDENYPSYRAVMDNFQVFSKRDMYMH